MLDSVLLLVAEQAFKSQKLTIIHTDTVTLLTDSQNTIPNHHVPQH